MHLFFSGIGGAGISALANIALDMGFSVSGSDIGESQNTKILKSRGAIIEIGQSTAEIARVNNLKSINWLIRSSSISETSDEVEFAKKNNIKVSKRDDFINFVLKKEKLKLVAVCGTHGKTTTTAMLSWLFHKMNIPVSHIIGSNISWGKSGQYLPKSRYLILEADEYDRNFLAYQPEATILTSIDYDHPDTYPTKEDYLAAFREFLLRSNLLVAYNEDLKKLGIDTWQNKDQSVKKDIWQLKKRFAGKIVSYNSFRLPGLHNRQNAALATSLFTKIFDNHQQTANPTIEIHNHQLIAELEEIISTFPGTQRRMELLNKNVYTDYAHHPGEIQATLQLAGELGDEVVVVYQPHQNLRQYEILPLYKFSFQSAKKVYWLPTYLTRENPGLKVLSQAELISSLADPKLAVEAELNGDLLESLKKDHEEGKIIIFMGAGSIDSWARKNSDKIID
jgi:UDP-N-acetylmuramate--alanine ligase